MKCWDRPGAGWVCLDESETWGNELEIYDQLKYLGLNAFLWSSRERTGDGCIFLDKLEALGYKLESRW